MSLVVFLVYEEGAVLFVDGVVCEVEVVVLKVALAGALEG
jgi:hypothetical protein